MKSGSWREHLNCSVTAWSNAPGSRRNVRAPRRLLAFLYLSLVGSVLLLSYSIYLCNPVFIAGFSLNLVIYLRNLYFIHRKPPAADEDATSDGQDETA